MTLAIDGPPADRAPMGAPPHAGVHFPPPLIYAAGLLGGWLIDRRWPIPIATDMPLLLDLLALGLAAVWLALMAGAMFTFVRARTTLLPNRPAKTLATGGPYRMTRNPMYLSLAALYVSLTIVLNSWWPVIFFPAAILTIDRFVIVKEERYLAAAFPAEYAAYRRRVGRWL